MRIDSILILHFFVKWHYLHKRSTLSDLLCLQLRNKKIHPDKFFLIFNKHMNHLEDLIKVLFLIQSSWDPACNSVLLTNSWVMWCCWSMKHTLNCKSLNNLITKILLHLYVTILYWEQTYQCLKLPWFRVCCCCFETLQMYFTPFCNKNTHIFMIEFKSVWNSSNSSMNIILANIMWKHIWTTYYYKNIYKQINSSSPSPFCFYLYPLFSFSTSSFFFFTCLRPEFRGKRIKPQMFITYL